MVVKGKQEEWKLLLPLVLGNMLNPLNSTMLATALTTICHSFGRNVSDGVLLIVPLYMTSAICMPLMGRLADVFSAKKINFIGLVLVLVSVVIGIFAIDFTWLVVSRTILGIGTSAAYPSVMAIIKKKYTEEGVEIPGRVLGWISMASQISIVIGPVLGGLVAELMGWKGIFFINLPFIFTALYFSKNIPNSSLVPVALNKELLEKLDLIGAALFTLVLTTLLYVLMGNPNLWIFLPILAILLGLFIRWELKHPNPFIHLRLLLEKPMLSIIYIRSALTSLIFFSMIYGIPQWLQESKGIDPSHSGMILLPLSLASAGVAYVSSGSQHYLKLLVWGLISLCLSCVGILYLDTDSMIILIIGVTLLLGFSIGLNIIANQASLYAEVPVEYTGISFGLFRTIGNIGTVLSGSELKEIFKQGATDSALHQLGMDSLICCGVIVLFLIPLLRRRFVGGKGRFCNRRL